MEEDQDRTSPNGETSADRGGEVSLGALAELRERIGATRVAMLTTVEPDGTLRSRPMTTRDLTDEGEVWFFTDGGSHKIGEVENNSHVNLIFHRPMRGLYLSISGTAYVVHDRQKMRDLWHPMLHAWFAEGLDDPTLCLVRVELERAECWDAPLGNLTQLARYAGALLGRNGRASPEMGRHTLLIRPLAGPAPEASRMPATAPLAAPPPPEEAGRKAQRRSAGRQGKKATEAR